MVTIILCFSYILTYRKVQIVYFFQKSCFAKRTCALDVIRRCQNFGEAVGLQNFWQMFKKYCQMTDNFQMSLIFPKLVFFSSYYRICSHKSIRYKIYLGALRIFLSNILSKRRGGKAQKIQCTKDGEVEQKKLYVHIFYYISAIFQKEQRLKTKTKEGAFGFFKTYIHYFNWGVNFVGADGWECTLWNVTFNANFGFEVVLYYFFVENGYIFMVSL
eukprot:TRINITY_DN14249_c0_g1_i5.p1 TRINITY_DN14249_c0_g1~~TRINITY_DN14249_c0_g1_i5.p1  ORF type:complete len:216 (-),score=0.58 TRINITY_DN14249_c0_g1_i5:215-862(-)